MAGGGCVIALLKLHAVSLPVGRLILQRHSVKFCSGPTSPIYYHASYTVGLLDWALALRHMRTCGRVLSVVDASQTRSEKNIMTLKIIKSHFLFKSHLDLNLIFNFFVQAGRQTPK